MLAEKAIAQSKDSVVIGDLNVENLIKAQDQIQTKLNDDEILVVTITAKGYEQLQLSKELQNWFDPVSRYEMINTGMIGKMLGVDYLSDALTENPKITENTMHVVPKNYNK